MSFISLQLGTADLVRARAFWSETMGLEVLASGPDSVTLAAGETQWTLVQAESPPPPAHFAFTIAENCFEEAVAWLRARVPLLPDPTGRERFDFTDWSAHAVYFDDPDGNICELIARHTLRESRRETFTILGLSEIGLVTDSVDATAERLGLPAYRPGSASFRPLGDEDGLLIVVERGRPWYPDNTRLAAPVPFTVTLADHRTLECRP